MADVFSSSFAAGQHTAWAASQYAWDPSQLQALPLAGSPASGSSGAASDHVSEGACSGGTPRDQSLGPLPVGWQDSARAGTGAAGGKELKGAHTRAPKGPLVCQVEGCGHDLSLEKGYYQRYRVCEPHMKLLSLVVNGKACRFCQQCGRFQELTEFDGNKRSCRARLLQHNARRRKRDPLETSRKDVSGRKCKSHHPWSDSSNDADMALGPGSGDVSLGAGGGNDKIMGNYSMDSGLDQGMKGRISAGPASSGGLSGGWTAAGMSGNVDGPAGVGQFPALLQQPMVPHLAQPSGIDPDLARCFSGGTDMGDTLDEMLDGILNGNTEYIEDPRAGLQQPVGMVQPGGAFSAGAGLPAGMSGSFSLPPEARLSQVGMMSVGMNSSPPVSGTMVVGGGAGSMASSVPTSGAWQQGGVGMGLDSGAPAADLAAALNKRAAPQQRTMQEQQLLLQQLQQQQLAQQQQLQQQQKLQQQLLQQQQLAQQQQLQQQLLQQQQLAAQQQQQLLMQQQQKLGGAMGRPVVSMGAPSSLSQMDTYINSNSSIMTGAGFDNPAALSGGLVGQVGSNPGLSRGAGGVVGPWSGVNPIGGANAEIMSGMSINSNTSHASAVGLGGMAAGPVLPGAGVAAAGATAAAAAPGSSFDLARRLVAGGGAAAQYQSEDLLVRVSIKIANCTPDQLPPDLYARLRNLLNTADASLVQGFLRPGCTHLVLDVQVDTSAAAAGGFCDGDEDAPNAGLSLSPADVRAALGSALAGRCAVLVQTEGEVAMWPAGAPSGAIPSANARVAELHAAGELPTIHHVSAAAHIDGQGRGALLVFGTGLTRAGVELSGRIQGGYVSLSIQPLVERERVVAAAAADAKLSAVAAGALLYGRALERAGHKAEDVLLVTLEGAPGTGLLLLEAQTGPLLGNWRPCLLSTDATIAAELSACAGRAVRAGAAALASLESFVLDLGRVLDKRSYGSRGESRGGPGSLEEVEEAEDEADSEPVGPVAASTQSSSASAAQDDDDAEVTLALVCVCERLLATAADAGMARVSTFLAGALWQYGQDVQAILEAPYADGLAIVHRCMRSGSPAVVRALLAWIKMSGVQIDLGASGPPLGVSPLHLAALVPATWQVLAAVPAVRKCWRSARAATDGATPLQLQQQLLVRLPRGALPQEVVDAFAPKPRPNAAAASPGQSGAVATAEAAPVTALTTAAPEPLLECVARAGAGGMPDAHPSKDLATVTTAASYAGKPRGAIALMGAMFILSALAVLLPSRLLAPRAVGGVNGQATESAAQRLLAGCCSTLMYGSLLGLAILLLPLNSAGVILSQFSPSSP